MKIENWPLDRIIPYTGNPRKRSKQAVAKVAASIREFGVRQPIVVDEAGVILVGHTRRDSAVLLAMPTFPVHQALGLSEAQKRAYRVADNRTNEESEWNPELLAIEIKALDGFDLDLSLTGFDPSELAGCLNVGARPGEDDVPEPGDTITKRGDLWVLGEHRLLCGDCTRAEQVAVVLDGAKPLLLVTDPPYGVELDNEWRDRAGLNGCGPAEVSYMKHRIEGHEETSISGDTRADWSEAFALVSSLEVAYVWHATSHMVEVVQGLERIGFQLRQQLIWSKTAAAISRSAYHWQHEPCIYAVRKGKTAKWRGSRDQTTVWTAASPKMIMAGSSEQKFDHPTQKPAELMRRPLLNHTVKGDAVYDPFLGSGTTLIACETEGRRCYGLEIEPRYCEVIVTRWEEFTGQKAVRHSEVI